MSHSEKVVKEKNTTEDGPLVHLNNVISLSPDVKSNFSTESCKITKKPTIKWHNKQSKGCNLTLLEKSPRHNASFLLFIAFRESPMKIVGGLVDSGEMEMVTALEEVRGMAMMDSMDKVLSNLLDAEGTEMVMEGSMDKMLKNFWEEEEMFS